MEKITLHESGAVSVDGVKSQLRWRKSSGWQSQYHLVDDAVERFHHYSRTIFVRKVRDYVFARGEFKESM